MKRMRIRLTQVAVRKTTNSADSHQEAPRCSETNVGLERVRPAGFEPATYGLEVRCSIQLSYGRVLGK